MVTGTSTKESAVPNFSVLPPLVIFDGFRYGIRFYRSNDLSWGTIWNTMKESRGSFNKQAKMWVFGDRISLEKGVQQIVEHTDPHGKKNFKWLFGEKIRKAELKPREFYFSSSLQPCLWPFSDEGSSGSVAAYAFDSVLSGSVKRSGGQWWGDEKVWVIPEREPEWIAENIFLKLGVRMEDIVISDVNYDTGMGKSWMKTGFLKLGVSASPMEGCQDVLPEGMGENKRASVLMSSPMQMLDLDAEEVSRMSAVCSLKPHQEIAVRHLLTRTSALLADDMGLGKTRSAVVAGKLAGKKRLVVCPATLKRNWQKEIQMVFPDEDIFVVNSGKSVVPESAGWVIANYETLGPIRESDQYDVLIVDEAHNLKEASRQRTKRMFQISKAIPRRYLLTATPILNRAEEIWTLMVIGGHPLASIPWEDFKSTYTKSHEARSLMAKRLAEWMLRREKDECLTLPGRYEINPELTLPEASVEQYNSIVGNGSILNIAKVTPLRKLIEWSKMDFIVESLSDMSPDSKAIVFCEYLENVDFLMERLEESDIAAVRLTGSEGQRDRNEAVDAFQNDPDIRVFVTTIRAGGVGITLTRANFVILASRPWTPALKDQAECRADRMGQERRVCVVNPIIRGTIDEDIEKMLEMKGEIIESVVVNSLKPVCA